jgi:hypothetical protein
MWGETIEIASTIVYFYEEDELIWSFQSSGLYSFHSLCMVIQFLWLLSKNMLLTRDNLEKRRRVDDTSCLFCLEKESGNHLFFDCVIARRAWPVIIDL